MLKIVNEVSVRARVRARVCVGNARQCDDDRGMQGKGKPTQGSSGEADHLAQAGVE